MTSFTVLFQDTCLIDITPFRANGLVNLVIARWPCQDLSMAENQNGLQAKQNAFFQELIKLLQIIQSTQTYGLGYIIENVPIILKSNERNFEEC